MILWTVKLLNSLRRAIAGRKYPHQLAWAVSFGLLLGVVPHGNLLAIVLLLVVLSLKINHAMAGLTAVAATFVATKLDPYSHRVGDFVLTHPRLSEAATDAWQLPMVPWTDLNNTVVMGSFLIGVGALVPVFMVTYPIFRLFAPDDEHAESESLRGAQEDHEDRESTFDSVDDRDGRHSVVLFDDGHRSVPAPHRRSKSSSDAGRVSPSHSDVDFVEVTGEDSENQVAVETRIDVIRMKDAGDLNSAQSSDDAIDKQPMDEALNYLLRQLRDSQQRNAA